MKTHYLKTVNPYYEAVHNGTKRAELRKDDRHFNTGDEVYLQEYDATTKTYSGRQVRAEITYVLPYHESLTEGYCMFCFKVTQHITSFEPDKMFKG